MSTSRPAARGAVIGDFYAIAEAERFHELIDGTIVEKAAPSGHHGVAQTGIIITVGGPYHRSSGRGGPGGWWIVTEAEVQLDTNIVRPDVAGWRRERCPERPTGMPVTLRPDWICEVLSPSNSANDRVTKLRLYHRMGVPHYWLVDPQESSLVVLRWSEAGYVTVLSAVRGETVRAEPFTEVDLVVGMLFGDEPT